MKINYLAVSLFFFITKSKPIYDYTNKNYWDIDMKIKERPLTLFIPTSKDLHDYISRDYFANTEQWLKDADLDPMMISIVDKLIAGGLCPIWSCQGHSITIAPGKVRRKESYLTIADTNPVATDNLVRFWLRIAPRFSYHPHTVFGGYGVLRCIGKTTKPRRLVNGAWTNVISMHARIYDDELRGLLWQTMEALLSGLIDGYGCIPDIHIDVEDMIPKFSDHGVVLDESELDEIMSHKYWPALLTHRLITSNISGFRFDSDDLNRRVKSCGLFQL